uniref:Elongin B n=1 Tax=Panthera tigris altaica TaxID=74533 RepID=A0A8C9K9E0_PANTA
SNSHLTAKLHIKKMKRFVPGGRAGIQIKPACGQTDDQLLDDGKTLGECGFTSQTARPQAPATVGLAFRADDAFEALRIEPFSSPPELSANEQAVQ